MGSLTDWVRIAACGICCCRSNFYWIVGDIKYKIYLGFQLAIPGIVLARVSSLNLISPIDRR